MFGPKVKKPVENMDLKDNTLGKPEPIQTKNIWKYILVIRQIFEYIQISIMYEF